MAFESLSDKLASVFKKLRGKGKLTEQDIKDAMREVRMALLEADVNYKVAKDFIAGVTQRAMGQEVMESIHIKSKPPTVIMMCGLQGAGKTTHTAKLAKHFIKEGHRPLLAACDIYRPAAVDQLKIVGEKAGAPVFALPGEKPEAIAKKAVAHAKDYGNDIVILDTAGRLHVDGDLMAELQRIKENVQVDETLLVIDAMAGQDAVNVAKSFSESTGLDGVILTKLDGDTRGGSALSVRAVTGKPIKFAGVGEKLDDLEVFHPSRMASRILGMGDVLSLIEKAEQALDQKKAAELEQKMRANKFTLADFYDQLLQIRKMGPMQDLLGMIPGMGSMKNVQVDESALGRVEAIILSMTPYERENPACLNSSRKRRIALGCGQKVEDVNRLLKQFDQMQQLMKQMNGKGKKRKLPGKMGGFPGFPGM